MGLRKLGAGCPTGPAMPPGRWLGLGGTCASAHAANLQHLLSICRESHGSRGFDARCVPSRVPDIGKLPLGTRRICDVDDERNAQPADRSLPADEARPHNGFTGRQDAGGGEQSDVGAETRRIGALGRVERAGAKCADAAFAGIAGGGGLARPAATRVCRNTKCAGGAGRHGEVADQPRKDRVGEDLAADGSEAGMTKGVTMSLAVEVTAGTTLPMGVEQ